MPLVPLRPWYADPKRTLCHGEAAEDLRLGLTYVFHRASCEDPASYPSSAPCGESRHYLPQAMAGRIWWGWRQSVSGADTLFEFYKVSEVGTCAQCMGRRPKLQRDFLRAWSPLLDDPVDVWREGQIRASRNVVALG